MFFLMSLYEWNTREIGLYYSFGEWLAMTGHSVFKEPFVIGVFVSSIVLFILYLLILRPYRAVKQLRELSPGGIPFTYDFYEDHVVEMAKTEKSDEVVRFKYSEVQRKIIETKYHIIIITGQRIKLSFYKTIMTPDEAIHVMDLLKERCPQRKNT